MTAWNFMSYESKDNLLEAIRRELECQPGDLLAYRPSE